MKTAIAVIALGLLLLGTIDNVEAGCSFSEKIFVCNKASKAAFAVAFSAAAAAPAIGCKKMTESQWKKVGCDSPRSHKSTKMCAPAKWSGVLKMFATAMSLKKKVLFKKPWTMSKLFNTKSGRSLVRHELAHIRQQRGISSYKFGYRYISGYCKAGCSYSKNR